MVFPVSMDIATHRIIYRNTIIIRKNSPIFPGEGEERQRWHRHLPGGRSRGAILRRLPLVLREGARSIPDAGGEDHEFTVVTRPGELTNIAMVKMAQSK